MRRKIESSEAQIEMAADVEEDDAFDAMLPACTKSAFSIKRASSIVSLCSKGEVAFGARECGRWQHAESEAPKAEPQAEEGKDVGTAWQGGYPVVPSPSSVILHSHHIVSLYLGGRSESESRTHRVRRLPKVLDGCRGVPCLYYSSTCIYIYVHVHEYKYIHIYLHMCIYIYVCVYT